VVFSKQDYMGFNLLENVNVLDLGREISGPLCAKLLADLGAQVIKVEPPTGDPARSTGPFPGDLPDPEQSGLFLALNANKLGVTINLETATGRDLLLQLVDQTDLIIENFPPSYLGDLGIGYNVLSARNPNLVLTSVTPLAIPARGPTTWPITSPFATSAATPESILDQWKTCRPNHRCNWRHGRRNSSLV
jgi:crotonobetainyl-CoA:carnitine CoA-transferase CaiB-like acyl-CoA transferase